MPGCCIKNCRRGSGKDRRGPQGNKVSLFYFPKDPKLREQWLKACQRKEGELKLSYGKFILVIYKIQCVK